MVRTISLLLHGVTAMILLHFLLLLAFRTLLLAKCLNLRVRHAHTLAALPLRLDRVIRLLGNIHHPVRMLTLPLIANSWMREVFHHHQVVAMGCPRGHRTCHAFRLCQSLLSFVVFVWIVIFQGIMGVFSPFSDKGSGPASLLTAGS
ncbi:hypothetical protein EDB83DRAFT_2375704 [Lactarius deliciosus]|nr:hypothetical protein EDB83DRAFT_2375704 [Lactarius deliciosus]